MTHPDREALAAYGAESLGASESAAVERHLEQCDSCRNRLVGDQQWLDDSWVALRVQIRIGDPTILERIATRTGIDTSAATIIGSAPTLRPAFLAALVIVTGFAFIAATGSTNQTELVLPFLGAAPLLPVLGVAMSYERRDAITEVLDVAPHGGLRLVLYRSIAVSVTSLIIGVAAAVLSLPPDLAFIWLLPTLTLSAVTLALSTRIDTAYAAGAVALVWLLIVGMAFVSGDALVAFATGIHAAALVVALAGLTGMWQRTIRSPSR